MLVPIAALLGAASSGCTVQPPVQRPTLRINAQSAVATQARQMLETTARRVRSCYRGPRVASAGRQIVTTLLIRIAQDGSLGGLPEILSQQGVHPGNRPYAARMAEAAILSVIRCAPYTMPDDLVRGGLVEIELTFSPSASV